MRGWWAMMGALAALAFWSAPASASGDGGCYAVWSLEAQERSCASRIVIGPGNDTRVNMLLLLRERAGLAVEGPAGEANPWIYKDYGSTFLDWSMLTSLLYPRDPTDSDQDYTAFSGTRCQSVERGGEQLLAAVARNRLVNPRDRARLAEGREALVELCRSHAGRGAGTTPKGFASLDMPRSFASIEAREFGTYIAGAAAFYAGDWRGAKARFGTLRNARDEWVRETARYMEARNDLNDGMSGATDEWGYFDWEKIDKPLMQRSDDVFSAYLEAFPAGRYAASARGLQRRARWLQGAAARQEDAYARMLANIDPASRDAVALIEELDDKFIFTSGAKEQARDAMLLATIDLLRMRHIASEGEQEGYDYSRYYEGPSLTSDELDRQSSKFADQPELFAFLQANHAFFIEHDYRRVLTLLPDDARRASYSPLQFSGQVLRGMALARLGDRNEIGFWRELLQGSGNIYQRPTAQLGLALAWERAGQVSQVFAEGSPVTDERIRAILLEHSAAPEVLRGVASGAALTPDERKLAAFVLLYRELRHGGYAAALGDLALVPADGPVLDYDEETYQPQLPVGVFARGAVSGGYQCSALRETVARLARNSRDVKGRLCLGDFFRLNRFDNSYLDYSPPEGSLGSLAAYPGEAIARSRYYADIIAEPRVAREDRAYALYRAIHCYAPSRNNSCGGEDVEPAQRAAWFHRLKSEFGDTRWGREAEYYW